MNIATMERRLRVLLTLGTVAGVFLACQSTPMPAPQTASSSTYSLSTDGNFSVGLPAWPDGESPDEQTLHMTSNGSATVPIKTWPHIPRLVAESVRQMETICGNGICEEGETVDNCPEDCCIELYEYYEELCIQDKGWQKIIVYVNDLPRKILWKGPEQSWKNGAIIALHGGGGTYSNFCSGPPIGKPVEEFSDLAIAEGFAVFSLDSTYGLVTDAEGRSCGKRWDCNAQDDRPNIDLPFIGKVITETIPGLRPVDSSKAIFMTGISNGGFTTVLAATHFDDKITAFAPVSAGDPYGTYFDMGTPSLRKCAKGTFRDFETKEMINQVDACVAEAYPNEKDWATANPEEKPPFKQFHHQGDGLCDISCMEKTHRLLIEHGYKDDGPFILSGTRSIWKHFWMEEYNQPIIEFFTTALFTQYQVYLPLILKDHP